MLITQHQYLDAYLIDRSATKLILGTIHPHRHEEFQTQFFYGNENSIWKILHNIFPEELANPSDVESILAFLKHRKLTISDTIVSCIRLSPTSLDKDLEIIEDNKQRLLDAIVNSQISQIICTSGFGKNNAFNLFFNRILGLPITKTIVKDRQATVKIPNSNKQILIKAIYSPARTALRGIANSSGYKSRNDKLTVEQYRQLLCQEAFK